MAELLIAALIASSCAPAQTVGREPGRGWVTGRCSGGEDLEYGVFQSASQGEKVSYHVKLPPSYNSDLERRFPVIYWLHGNEGSTRTCSGVSFVSSFYDGLMRSGTMPEAIVVFPNGLDRGMWCDSRDGQSRPESMLVRDLVPQIDSRYRTIPTREFRAVEGFSVGGYGAARMAFKYGSVFGSATMYAAGPLHEDFLENDPSLQPLAARSRIFREVYGNDAGYYTENSPKALALKVLESLHLRSQPYLRIIVGSLDPLRSKNRELAEMLHGELGIDCAYTEIEGVDHNVRALLSSSKAQTSEFYQAVFSASGKNPPTEGQKD